MAVIRDNREIAKDIYMLTLAGVAPGAAGQFVELHLPDGAMLLPRPISLFDTDEERGETTLVYRIAGKGTQLLGTLKCGELRVTGPLGNGFPIEDGPAVLIGGGLGIAPLYLLLKTLKRADPAREVSVYLGYTEPVFLKEHFFDLADIVTAQTGGYITDAVDFSREAVYYACGPAPMMRAAAKKASEYGRKLYVSLESRMACGVGACLGCSIETINGNRRVCKDGPVFDAREVYYE